MGVNKKIIVLILLVLPFLLTSCGVVKKIENQTKISDEGKSKNLNVSNMNFEMDSISEIRNSVEKCMSSLGTDRSEYENIAKTSIIPIITDKDEIYNIELKRMDGNELTESGNFNDIIASKKIINSNMIYRNNKEKIKKKLNISVETDVQDLIDFVEKDMDNTYNDSPFKWITEYVEVNTSSDGNDFVSISIRPSYDGVVFTRTLVLNNGTPTNSASDFRGGLLNITSMNKIDEYYGISPYYEVNKQGEAISQILNIESVLSIVANKIDKDSVSEIKLFELAYRLNKDLSAVLIWNIVVNENGNDRNFQIDAVTGDVYFE